MKKFLVNLLPILLVFASCDKADELLDVSFETTLSKTLPVSVVSTDEMTTSIAFDATSDPEIMKYADKIKSYEITELTFAIENYSSALSSEIYFNGVFGFSKITASIPLKTCPISPLNITHVAGTGAFDVDPCTSLANDMAQLFAEDNALKIYLKGAYTKEPLSFNLLVTIKAKIIANPL